MKKLLVVALLALSGCFEAGGEQQTEAPPVVHQQMVCEVIWGSTSGFGAAISRCTDTLNGNTCYWASDGRFSCVKP